MLVSKAAKRYATALIGISREDNKLDQILNDVKMSLNTIKDSRDLSLFLQSPIIKPDQKVKAIEAIFAGKVDKLLSDFMRFVASKKRAGIISQVLQSFVDKYEEINGIINVEVRSAIELTEDHTEKLKSILEETTGKTVHLHASVNKDLKGGLAVKINDTVIDGTVKHKLEKLEEQFLAKAEG